MIWTRYERAHQEVLDRPPTRPQRQAVRDWLTLMRLTPEEAPALAIRHPVLTPLVHLDVTDLASAAVQLGCRLHAEVDSPDISPFGIGFSVDARPWSARSVGALEVATREAVSRELAERGTLRLPWGDQQVCLTVSVVVPARERPKDVDNLVEGLLDASTGYLYFDDGLVSCLTVRRFEYAGERGYDLLDARPVLPPEDLVIIDDGRPPVFG